jgi:hypothetical protein
MVRRKRCGINLLVLCACIPAFALAGSTQELRSGDALLRAMHDRYQDDWYETLTFTQKSITIKPDGREQTETWHEALMLPGKLRIDIGPLQDDTGMLFSDGKLNVFKEGKLTQTRPYVHMLLVLGFDVYRQPPEKTVEQVKGEAFDLTKIHEDVWQGEPVYVVGADKGDLKSKQFWIESKRLLFVRLIEDRGDGKTSDARFSDYRKLSVGWVAAQVNLAVDGKEVFREEYSDIQVNPKLNPAIFDPAKFATEHWEK